MLRAGTSGFSYKQWRGDFYPENLPEKRMLEFYSTELPTVELNSTFYRMPNPKTIQAWCQQVEPAFRFTVKASRRISHTGRLVHVEDSVQQLQSLLGEFGRKLAIVLVQLPPNLPKDLARLTHFLELWGDQYRLALEFRHPSWFESDVVDVLGKHNAALCLGDPEKSERSAPWTRTADFAFLRLRAASYSTEELSTWSEQIEKLGAKESYAYFKHEQRGPEYARTLNTLMKAHPTR